ncbi:hypothetical protein BUALT_Bualt11G0086300 [Buddleja alternifolia]|uniref:Mal d 1-associated protein n=1 Tax=Buddleja alternifolia TaxID=168488 RepID=A0AAV6WTJ1_9LAMI|nr:hypothetical protein BUALT_Bualt11G0086300 [Buddleja alternifolia]
MGWVWKDDDDSGDVSSSAGDFQRSSNPNDIGDGESRAVRKVVKSQCRTEEVEPGKFIRKCEKTEEIFKHCVGRPDEVVRSIKECTEEDVTDQMVKGSFPLDSAENGSSYFPGLRNDIDAIERDFFGGINRFFEAAEDLKNELFGHAFDNDSASSHKKREFHIQGPLREEALPKKSSNAEVDFSGLARDV